MKNTPQSPCLPEAEEMHQRNVELKKWLLSQSEVSTVVIENNGADVFASCHQNTEQKDSSGDEKTKLWSRIFDIHYQKISSEGDAELNTNVWKSSYNGQEIPKVEMKEWIQTTVQRVLRRHPTQARVLEIGCGNGLILASLLPHISSYVGIDTSEHALRSIYNSFKNDPNLSKVQLFQAEAKDIDKIPRNILEIAFDIVVINSVAQYFPSVDYLNTVLKNLEPFLKSDSTLFIGDVRSFALNEVFLLDIIAHRSSGDMLISDLKKLLERQKAKEAETLYDPRLFKLLRKNFNWVDSVTTQLRRGQHHNEMNKFRYDVEIQCKKSQQKNVISALKIDWEKEHFNLQKLADLFKQDSQDAYQIINIPNSRIFNAVEVHNKLQTARADTKLSDILNPLHNTESIDPETLWQLADKHDVIIEIDWDTESSLERMTLRFSKNTNSEIAEKVHKPQLSQLSNKLTLPLESSFFTELNRRAKDHFKEAAPEKGIRLVSESTMNLLS